MFASQDSSKSGEFEDYLDLLPRFAMDANENAKEKGLEALLIFIQEAHVARTYVSQEIMFAQETIVWLSFVLQNCG